MQLTYHRRFPLTRCIVFRFVVGRNCPEISAIKEGIAFGIELFSSVVRFEGISLRYLDILMRRCALLCFVFVFEGKLQQIDCRLFLWILELGLLLMSWLNVSGCFAGCRLGE